MFTSTAGCRNVVGTKNVSVLIFSFDLLTKTKTEMMLHSQMTEAENFCEFNF